MPENNNYAEIFTKPEAPRSDWELFKWLFFEPTLLKTLTKSLKDNNKQDKIAVFRLYYKFIMPIVILIWLLMITILTITNTPSLYPEIFLPTNYDDIFSMKIIISNFSENLASELAFNWENTNGFISKWMFLASSQILVLVFALVVGLLFSLPSISKKIDNNSNYIFKERTAFVVSIVLTFSLFGGMSLGLAVSLTSGIFFSIFFGLINEISRTTKTIIAPHLSPGLLNEGLGTSQAAGPVAFMALAVILALRGELIHLQEMVFSILISGIICFVFYFVVRMRVFVYIYYFKSIFKKHTLINNPYLNDEVIWLPLPWVKKDLIEDTKKLVLLVPDIDERYKLPSEYINFLLRYRPLQLRLAAELELTTLVESWRSVLKLRSALFHNLRLLSDELPEGWAKLMPSTIWRDKIGELRDTLAAAEDTTAVVNQLTLYQNCKELVEEFRQINLRETFKGREEFFAVIDHWNRVLDNQIQETAKKVNEIQAVTLNPYSKGSALTPEIAQNRSLFLDRADIREELSLKIQTSVIMPTFLILGQRRVGKTSLLNFLPSLLDPTLFDVVVVDAQALSGEVSLIKWLVYWRSRIESKLKLPATEPAATTDALSAWDEFAAFLDGLAQTRKRRLILAMDEYDEDRGFHYAIRQDPEVGAAFLGRMRAFSQQQKMVVFMFVGATNFSDLPEPKWSKYFVHVHEVRVDYLSEQASMQIIERPIPGFGLRYAEGVAAHIYHLTQGHPHLLHTICSDLVDYANMKVKNPVDRDDLAYILQSKVLLGGAQPFSVFWDEFCEKESMKEAVRAIAAREGNIAKTAEVRKLLDYGFIVPDQALGFRMRVPLFEEWVKEYGY